MRNLIMSSTVFECDELLAGVEKVLNELAADSRNVRSQSTAEMVHANLTRLIAQKDALYKNKFQLADMKSLLQGVQVQKETIERLNQKVAVDEGERALAMNCKNFFDKESLKVGELKVKVHQKFKNQHELLENRVDRAKEFLSRVSFGSGIRIKSTDGHQRLVIELVNPTKVETLSTSIPSVDDEFQVVKRPTNGLEVSITFSQTPTHCQRIASIAINADTLSADDLIKKAIAMNDIQWFLIELRQRWLKSNSLSAEIEPLSHRYALDWLNDEGLIRVLYGGDASIVCTLKLNNYPENTIDGVTLHSASGLPAGITSESLQIPSHATLKVALEFLESRLSSRH